MAFAFANDLENLPPGYTYDRQSHNDEVILHIKEINDKESALQWLQTWSDVTKVTWRKRTTYPRAGRLNCYKIDMKCQHAADKRVKGSHTKKTGCTAVLQIKVAEGDGKDWPTTVSLRGSHNHAIHTPAALKYRDIGFETKEKLLSFFRLGYSASAALHLLKTDLLIEHGNNYFKYACDGKYAPSLSIVHHLFNNEFLKEHGPISTELSLEYVEHRMKKYTAESDGIATFNFTSDKEHYFIVICTPIMLRAQTVLTQSKEIVLIDSSGGMDKEKHRLYFFLTPTIAGGIPLAAILTDSEKRSVFFEAVQKLKEIVPDDSALKTHGPQIFMTDNDLKERDCLRHHYPQSMLLLCQFHVLKAVWSWLLKVNHNILQCDRQELYFLFKKVLYSNTEDQFDANNKILLSNKTVQKYENFENYYKKLLDQKMDWVLCYRANLFVRGSNTTNYVEVMFRIMKECILNRVMAYNLCQFADIIITRFEMYFQKRLLDFCHDKYCNYAIKYMTSEPVKNFILTESNEPDVYYLYDSTKKVNFTVDISNGMCSCLEGNTGKICQHSAFLLNKLQDSVQTNFNYKSKEIKRKIFFIANGSDAPADWFDSLVSEPKSLPLPCPPSPNQVKETDPVMPIMDTSPNSVSQVTKLNENEVEKLNNFYKRINEGLENDPENFVPAVRKMLINMESTKTDTSFLSALHTFGKPQNYLSINCAKKIVKKRCHNRFIAVQPTAIGRRLKTLPGQKIVHAGRPKKSNQYLKQHDYTTFGYLPKRKRKATHNLQDAVFSNKSLGD